MDNLSSAHIYLRLPEGQNWENIEKELLIDCAQLTKANSIEGKTVMLGFVIYCELPKLTDIGNKKDNITVIYTPWSNLKKDGSMAVGQVGFKDNRKVVF